MNAVGRRRRTSALAVIATTVTLVVGLPPADALVQVAKLYPDGDGHGSFGGALALDGNTAVAGSPFFGGGRAYVYVRSGGAWAQQDVLLAEDFTGFDMFGDAVAIDGNTIVVGSFRHASALEADDSVGAAYVFTRSGSTWTQEAELLASDGGPYDNFGSSVTVDGDTIIVGASGESIDEIDQGAAYVFTRSGTTWTERAKLTAADPGDTDIFGAGGSALEDGTAVIGAYHDDDGRGSVYVFTGSGAAWSQQAKLTPADGAALDRFGFAAQLAGDTVVIGSPWHDVGPNEDQGAAYVFTRSGTTWTHRATITASDGDGADLFAETVALDGDMMLAGAPVADQGAYHGIGAAYLFRGSGATWTQESKLTASDGVTDAEGYGDGFGYPVAVQGDSLLVGSSSDDTGEGRHGALYAFDLDAPAGTVTGTVTDRKTHQPVGGAKIEFAGGVTRTATFTETDGTFSTTLAARSDLGDGHYDMTISAFGYEPATEHFKVREGVTKKHNAQLKPLRNHLVTGRVVDDAGNPLEGVDVFVDRSPIPPTKTGADGTYSLGRMPVGSYDLWFLPVAQPQGCVVRASLSLQVDGPETFNVTLERWRDHFGHTCKTLPAAWVAGTDSVSLTGDDRRVEVPMPFPFRFYGETYTSGWMSTNGVFALADPGGGLEDAGSTDLPNIRKPNGALYPKWDDLIMDDASSAYTAVLGAAPHRRFVVEWRDVLHYGGEGNRMSFEIVLDETTGSILFQYQGIDDDEERGFTTTVGIENATADDAMQFAGDFGQFLRDDLAIQYTGG